MPRPYRVPCPPSPLRARLLPCVFALALLAAICHPGPVHGDDGDPDLGFGLFGKAVRGSGSARAVVARADGSLRLAINRDLQVGFLALGENGAVDTSFGDNGVTMVGLPIGLYYSDIAAALFERPDGRLLMVAITADFTQGALVQVTADGELDPDFGTGGIRLFTHSGDDVRPYAATLLSDGKVLVAGICYDCGPTTSGDTFIARFTATGGTDTTFGSSGWAVFDAVEGATASDYAGAIATDSEGRILVGGSAGLDADERPYVARRLANGAVDTSFAGADGIRTLTALVEQEVTGIIVDPVLQKILVSTGDRGSSLPATCAVARLGNSGALDTTWSGDGIVPLTAEEGANLRGILLQSDGKIVGVGSIDADLDPVEGFLLVRLLADGALDPSFDGDGRKRVEFDLDLDPSNRDYALAATLSGGRIVAVGVANGTGATQVALYRSRNALVFTDGFERGTVAGWTGN